MRNVSKLSIGEFDVDSPDKSHAWRLHLNMHNSNDVICRITQKKCEVRATFDQYDLTTFPTSINVQT